MVDDVVPLIGDARRVESRQGAIEAVHRTSLLTFGMKLTI
jgi:hypothetical protein